MQGNILITAQGTVRVADVGLNTLIIQSMYDGFLPVSATWMYKAPEELLDGMVTMQTDTYATASTIYTVSMDQQCNCPCAGANR